MGKKKKWSIEYYPTYLKLVRTKSVRKFNSKEEVEEYLIVEVFEQIDFINNVIDTASEMKVSYLVAYTLITKYLIDVLYELDIAQSKERKKTRIRIPGFLNIDIAFIASLKGKLFSLQKDLRAFLPKRVPTLKQRKL